MSFRCSVCLTGQEPGKVPHRVNLTRKNGSIERELLLCAWCRNALLSVSLADLMERYRPKVHLHPSPPSGPVLAGRSMLNGRKP